MASVVVDVTDAADDWLDGDLAGIAEWDENYIDVADVLPCPRCGSPEYDHDDDCRAYICDGCGLYLEDDDTQEW